MFIVAAMDKSHSDSVVHIVCVNRGAVADCVYGKRWFHKKGSTNLGWRTVCADISATLHMAHSPAYASFYKTNSAEANHSHIMDGAHLLRQCGKIKT